MYEHDSHSESIQKEWANLQSDWNKLDQQDKDDIRECFNEITAPLYFKGFGDFLFEGEHKHVQERFKWMAKDEREYCIEQLI